MGRGHNRTAVAVNATVASGLRPHLQEREEQFRSLFGERRGSGRPDPLRDPLPYRTVERGSVLREYDPVDGLVRVCEMCGNYDFLRRDWDDPRHPALCSECFALQPHADPHDPHCCENWCVTEDLAHSGLCSPLIPLA